MPLGDPNHGEQKEQEHQQHMVKPNQIQIEIAARLTGLRSKRYDIGIRVLGDDCPGHVCLSRHTTPVGWFLYMW